MAELSATLGAQVVVMISAQAPPISLLLRQDISWWGLSAAREVQETLEAIFLFR
jgi:hypothetical protein